jgi:magnesium-transporting ATPase (P-type)
LITFCRCFDTGYGYHHPSDDNSRLFTIFAMIFGVSVIFTGFSTAMSHRLAAMTRSENIAGDFEDVENVMRRLRRRVILNILAVIVCLFAVATFFCWMEDWTFITAFYFAVQTATVSSFAKCKILRLSP